MIAGYRVLATGAAPGDVGGMEIAFEDAAAELREQIREAVVDHAAFSAPLKPCQLAECRATCCHDGVYLEEAERVVIDGVIEANRERLAAAGWTAGKIFETRGGRGKSVTVAAETGELAGDFPVHFPKTRCVFLDSEHRCVLQSLAMDEGRHPWFWKPISCWMHPLVLIPGKRGGRPLLTLATAETDPAAAPGYPGFSSCTPCGMPRAGGRPAWQVLREELELLGRIGGRDLLRELD